MRAKLELIILFVAYVLSNASYRGQNNDVCSPFDIGCRDYGLADYYPRYHFNGRYMGDERMRIPFSIALNAPILGICWSTQCYKNALRWNECVISALGDDSGHLFLMDTDIDERKFLNTEIGVSSSAIFDVCWLTNSLIGIASGDSNVYLFDVFKGEFTQRRGHTKSVRCVKHAASRVYTGGSDGKVFCWDVRSKDPVLELNFYPRGHKMVSALELNREEEYTIYATATPGTILNTWDLRYTKRGMYISEQNSIANAITNSIYHKDRHIYLLLSNSGVLRLTETGTFMNYVQPGSTYGVSNGKIDYSAHLDLVLAGFANKVVLFDTKYTHLACTHDIGPINGLNCIRRNNFLTYDEYGRVTIYEMVFKQTHVQII